MEDFPVFNLENQDGEERGATMEKIKDALEKWGGFEIENHGIYISKNQYKKFMADKDTDLVERLANNEVILLDFWASMLGMSVRVALAEKGIKYEYKEQDLMRNECPLLDRMNPVHKQVPVLIHNGKPICESLFILQYIEEVWKYNPQLLPSDPYQRHQARFWADFVYKKVHDAGLKVLTKKGEEQEAAKRYFLESLKVLEGELGEKAYFGGETFGLVDIALIPSYSWFYAYETVGKFRIEADCPNIIAWAEKCMQKESVSKSLPDPKKVYEFAVEMRKKLGLD